DGIDGLHGIEDPEQEVVHPHENTHHTLRGCRAIVCFLPDASTRASTFHMCSARSQRVTRTFSGWMPGREPSRDGASWASARRMPPVPATCASTSSAPKPPERRPSAAAGWDGSTTSPARRRRLLLMHRLREVPLG